MVKKSGKSNSPLERKERIIKAYKRLFDSVDGKLVLEDLYKTCNFDVSSFVPGDPYATSFNEGKREVVLRLFQTLDADLETIININRQYQSEQEGIYDD